MPFIFIMLNNGHVTEVSPEDFEELNQYNWSARYGDTSGSWYAQRSYRVDGVTISIGMARQILGLEPGDPRQADHINHQTLNTRGNLRIATASQNCCNRRRRSDNTSTFKGVSWNRSYGRWRVQVWLNHTNRLVGHYLDKFEAALAYDAAARLHFGTFALVNFPAPASDELIAA
jgi:hypothetical protein